MTPNSLAYRIAAAIGKTVDGFEKECRANASALPEALIGVLGVTIATQYERRGHGTLLDLCNERLRQRVEEIYGKMQAEGDPRCDDEADRAELEAMARKLAEAMGLDVEAVHVEGPFTPAEAKARAEALKKEGKAVADSDDLSNLSPEAAAAVSKLMEGLTGKLN